MTSYRSIQPKGLDCNPWRTLPGSDFIFCSGLLYHPDRPATYLRLCRTGLEGS